MLDVAVLGYADVDAGVVAAWDSLAVVRGEPRSAPSLVLPWFDHVAGRGAARVLVVTDGCEVVGVLPLSIEPVRYGRAIYRNAGLGTLANVEALAVPGADQAVWAVLGREIAHLVPSARTVWFESMRGARTIIEATRWRGVGHRQYQTLTVEAGYLDLADGGYERWDQSRSSSGKREQRRRWRRLGEAGCRLHVLTEADDIVAWLPALQGAYLGGAEDRGGAGRFDDAVVGMLTDGARALAPEGRFVVHLLERAGELVSASLCVIAGDVISGWLTATVREASRLSAGYLTQLELLSWAHEQGLRRFDFGPGSEDYKHHLSSGRRHLEDARVDVDLRLGHLTGLVRRHAAVANR